MYTAGRAVRGTGSQDLILERAHGPCLLSFLFLRKNKAVFQEP